MKISGDLHELEDRVRDTILGFAHEHAPLMRKCAAEIAPGMDLQVAAVCIFLGNAAEQLTRIIGKDKTLELVTSTLDSIETINTTVKEAAQVGVKLDPVDLFLQQRSQKTS